MKIIAIDIGKWSAYWNGEHGEVFDVKSLSNWHGWIKMLIEGQRPDVIIYPHPVRYYNVLRMHWQYIGVLNLLSEQHGIQTIEVKDSQAKKLVLGNGKAKKEEIMKHFNEDNEHLADARLFWTWYIKS